MQEAQQLPEVIFTPSTKAEVGDHDENIDFAATVAAHAHFAMAAGVAGARAAGPGSFQVAFVDALHALNAGDLARADVQLETRAL